MNSEYQNSSVERTSTTRRAVPGKPSKTARLVAMLRRPKGATQKQLEASFGWQPHTVRAAISRLRKAGAVVTLDRSVRTPTYRIESGS